MTQEDKTTRYSEAVIKTIDGELAHPEISRVLKDYVFGPMNRIIAAKIAGTKAINIEELHPEVVRYWVTANSILAPQGYTVTIDVHDWSENPDYSEIDIRPVKEGDIFSYDSPPARAFFIISKKTGKLATNAEITESLRNHDGDEPIDYENQPAYGLELLVGGQLGKQVAKEFQQASPSNELKERKYVSHGLNEYGYMAAVFYQPQTPEEAQEAKPLLGHNAYLRLMEGKALEEFMRGTTATQ